MTTIALGHAALANQWPLWFGLRRVMKVRGVVIYHTHVAALPDAGLSRLTVKSMGTLRQMVNKWGEAQMPPAKAPAVPPTPKGNAPEAKRSYKKTTTPATSTAAPAVTNTSVATTPTVAPGALATTTASLVPPPRNDEMIVATNFGLSQKKNKKTTVSQPSADKLHLLDVWYENKNVHHINWKQLLKDKPYRGVHPDPINERKAELMAQGFSKQHPFVILRKGTRR